MLTRSSARRLLGLWTPLIAHGIVGCDPRPTGEEAAASASRPAAGSAAVVFVDVATQAGVTLRNVSGDPDKHHLVETTGSGGCFLDYDGDGDMDLYLVNGATLATWEGTSPVANALYRNEGDGRFRDVTEAAGVGDRGWGGGCSVADPDNDGDPDLYVTNFGRNVFYRNDGAGRFADATAQAGLGDGRWGSGAVFSDVDRDGDLDLYLANYAEFDAARPEANPSGCRWKGAPVMCGPRGFTGQRDVLYLNEGEGRFRIASEQAAVGRFARFGLGVVAGDLDADGDPDLYVANDSQENLLFVNRGDGRFDERGLVSGLALSGDGRQQAGMGVDLGDFDGDGDEDVFVTNFSDDYHTLYRNEGDGLFVDVSLAAGLATTRSSLGWGGGFFDYDNDGDLDLYVAGGHVYPQVDGADPGTAYRQRNLLLRNGGDGHFLDVSLESGPGLALEQSSRGVVFGDYDDDGDLDVVVVNEGDVPALLRNDGGNRRHWLKVRLIGALSNRDGIGARIRVEAGGREQLREHRLNAGYYASHDPRMHFGLGHVGEVDQLEILWPSGRRQVLRDLPVDHLVTVDELRGALAVEPLHPAGGPPAVAPHGAPEADAQRTASVPRAAGRTERISPEERARVEALAVAGTDSILAGRYAEAVDAYSEALERMPTWEQAVRSPDALGFGDPQRYRSLLSGIYDNMGVALLRAERLDACVEAVRLAIGIWPERAKYHHNLGLCHLHARRYAAAVDALRSARALDPRRSSLSYDLGRALALAGDCDEAVAHLERATQALPTPDLRARRAESWYHLGECRAAAGRHEQAGQAFRETLARVPGHQKALYKLSRAFRRSGRTVAAERALALFTARQPAEEAARATKLAGHRSHAWRLALGRAYLDAGQPQAALRELRTALAERPDDPRALTLLGDAALDLRPPRLDLAERAFRRVRAGTPEHVDALAGLGRIRLAQQRWTEAGALFERALAMQADHPPARMGLAQARFADGDAVGAIGGLQTLLAESPENADALRTLAALYVRPEAGALRDPARALSLLDRAGGAYGEGIETRLRAHRALGQEAEAERLQAESPFLADSLREGHGAP